ncbi:ferrous iron transport protein B [Microbispora catharanthi]|uniref:Ferrous iron transport protein B n=1 Tax=Microbispora catharanthi TaxID=1712871 RepID=A0A5N6BUA6_9ACTN|nr:ferrous iron transport protein B [Microbispora catharanthi]KAB8184021.1 ferrous iron transport protein B [Microbispora catharanthi]
MSERPITKGPVAKGPVAKGPVAKALLTKPCCDDDVPGGVNAGDPRVALVGNPNVGKSTLFNMLTGARQRIGNWPGKTVSVAQGTWRSPNGEITLIDLPGTYSLVPGSPDEALTRDLLVDRGMGGRPDLVVITVDAANLARNLYLLAQVMETGVPLVVALTMVDIAESRGIRVDAGRLSELIGAPVVPLVPRRGEGVAEFDRVVARALAAPRRPALPVLGEDMEAALASITAEVPAETAVRYPARWLSIALLTGEDVPGVPEETAAAARAAGAALSGGEPAGDDEPDDPELLVAEQRYAWVHEVIAEVVTRRGAGRATWSDRVDRVLTSRWSGPPIFLAVMWAVFALTTKAAAPLMAGFQGLVDGPVSTGAGRLLDALGAGGAIRGLVLNGLIAGVGQVLSFVPLMAIMFVLLSVLEDSGYLARAAFVVDRLMRVIGLPGRAFLPLIVGFGCNVPALAGTRILSDRRHRLLTGLLIPFVTCSARLTVYVLVATAFFGSAAGTVVFAMYVLSIALVIGMGLLLRGTLFRGMAEEPLVLDLPPYRLPAVRVIGAQSWVKLQAFLKTASGIIVATVTLVWLLSSIPFGGQGSFGRTPIEHSVFGAASHAVAPAFAPSGFGDWHASAALITGFVAKEAVVSTMAQTYSMGEPADGHQPGGLGGALRATIEQTSHGHPVPAVLAFLVFLLAYTPCMTTVAAQRVEIGGRLTLFGIGMQLTLAWLLAVAVFRVGSLFL